MLTERCGVTGEEERCATEPGIDCAMLGEDLDEEGDDCDEVELDAFAGTVVEVEAVADVEAEFGLVAEVDEEALVSTVILVFYKKFDPFLLFFNF
jgi:hypothetical protein